MSLQHCKARDPPQNHNAGLVVFNLAAASQAYKLIMLQAYTVM